MNGPRFAQTPSAPRARGDGGAVLVEAALVLPILLLFVLGLTEYSIAEFQSSQASSAARDGARVGILNYSQADVPGTPANDAIVAAAKARLPGQQNVSVAVTCLTPAGVTKACSAAFADQDRIQVVVSWPYKKITGAVPAVPTTITATSRMALTGQIIDTVTTLPNGSTTTSTSSTSTTSTSTSTSTTSTTMPATACSVSSVVADDGSGTAALPKVKNGNSGDLLNALNVRVTTNGSTQCLPVAVTVYPQGGGTTSGAPLSANGVAGSGGLYTTIFTEKVTHWQTGPLLIHVTWAGGGSQDLTVTLTN